MDKNDELDAAYNAWVSTDVNRLEQLYALKAHLSKMTKAEIAEYFDEHLLAVTQTHYKGSKVANKKHRGELMWKVMARNKKYDLQRWAKDNTTTKFRKINNKRGTASDPQPGLIFELPIDDQWYRNFLHVLSSKGAHSPDQGSL